MRKIGQKNPAHDAGPGQWDPCLVATMDTFTQTTEILWRKRDSMATLSVREGTREPERAPERANPCLDSLLLLFWAHYMEDGPHLLCTGLL